MRASGQSGGLGLSPGFVTSGQPVPLHTEPMWPGRKLMLTPVSYGCCKGQLATQMHGVRTRWGGTTAVSCHRHTAGRWDPESPDETPDLQGSEEPTLPHFPERPPGTTCPVKGQSGPQVS